MTTRRNPASQLARALTRLFGGEAGAGLLLIFTAALAMVLANSTLSGLYHALLHAPLPWTPVAKLETAHLWINDAVMAVFFFVVGLEIKRELLVGELSSPAKRRLPVLAAIGGMAVPALIYLAVAGGEPGLARGWAVPAATDIAFALGILSLLGSRVPVALKVFLTSLAIFDDLGAIIIIALFYTAQISLTSLAVAGACIPVLYLLNRYGVTARSVYRMVGIIMWVSMLKSGVHATLAGVVIGTMIPRKAMPKLERALHPWVTFGIMPIFALANAGASLEGVGLHTFTEPVALGIILGLFVGKQLGVFTACWLAVRSGIAQLPAGSTWATLHGVAIVTGIGFTMSLFVGSLAFGSNEYDTAVRLGVLTGSTLSAIVGCTWLVMLGRKR